MRKPALLSAVLLAATAITDVASAQTACSHHLLVSGYFSNNIAIFDACSGAFLRNLDNANLIRGPQAVRLNSDGRLYVVSEGNDRILRYDATTYEYVDTFAQLSANFDPTGLDIGPDDDVYVGSYGTSSVVRLNGQTGAQVSTVLPSNTNLRGVDNGLGFGPDGLLYVPGYDSDSVARVNTSTGAVQASFVTEGAGGLEETRGILFEPGGQTFLVSGEGSGAIYRFRTSDGSLVQTLITNLLRPTGMLIAPDGSLLVLAGPARVSRFNRETGAPLGTLLTAGTSGVNGGTFLTLVPNPTLTVDATQIGTQYWIAGAGNAQARRLDVELNSSTGTEFGANFNPADIVTKRWGSMSMQFQACDRAVFSYDSTGTNSANFGSANYEVTRIVDSEATVACRTAGFAQVSGFGWMSGTWFNTQRSGEGLTIEVSATGTVVAGFFTHLPQGF
ncbi:MAG: Vgb family protein [Pseudomarimonas sp.]